MRTRVSGFITSVALAMALLGIVSPAAAQDFGAPPPFRFEAAPRVLHGAPAVEGYVENTGLHRVSNVRLKVEALDDNGAVIEQVMGWVMGDINAGGRGYFIVALTHAAASHRVTVVSYDIVARGA